MTRYEFRARLNSHILSISLLFFPAGAIADEGPPFLKFAPQWLDKHASSPLTEAVVPAPFGAKECTKNNLANDKNIHQQLAAERERVKALRARLDAERDKKPRCKAIISERDKLKKRLSDLLAHQQTRSDSTASSNYIELQNELLAARAENNSLHNKYKSAITMLESERKLTSLSAAKLATETTEVALLKLENKVNTLRADVANAELVELRNLKYQNQQQIEKLLMSEKHARDEITSVRAKLAELQKVNSPDGVKANNGTHSFSQSTEPLTSLKNEAQENSNSLTSHPSETIISPTPENSVKTQVTGDYAAGVTIGREAINALEMNKMLGMQTSPEELYRGFTDTLKDNIPYTEKSLIEARTNLSSQIEAAREKMIKVQSEAGKKALSAFLRKPGAIKDEHGFWYRIEASSGSLLELKNTVDASIIAKVAGGGVIQHDEKIRKKVSEFPPLFRNVIAKIGQHGSVSFFVPPELAYGDQGLPPSIPPGSSMLYKIMVDVVHKDENNIENDVVLKTGKKFLDAFIREPGVKKSSSGFWYQIKKQGYGDLLSDESMVTTVMRESIAGGRVLNDMVADGQAITLQASNYPPLFREALILLRNHGAIRLVVPAKLAYVHRNNMPVGVQSDTVMIYDIRIINAERANEGELSAVKPKQKG